MRRVLSPIRRGGDEGSPALRVWTALTVLVSVFAITAHEDFGALRFSIAGLVALGFLFSWIRRRRNNPGEGGRAGAAGGGPRASAPPPAPPRLALQRGEAVPIAAALLGALLAVAGLVFLFTPRLSGLFITTL